MDDFLKVIYRNYASESELQDAFIGYFEELTEKIGKTISETTVPKSLST